MHLRHMNTNSAMASSRQENTMIRFRREVVEEELDRDVARAAVV